MSWRTLPYLSSSPLGLRVTDWLQDCFATMVFEHTPHGNIRA